MTVNLVRAPTDIPHSFPVSSEQSTIEIVVERSVPSVQHTQTSFYDPNFYAELEEQGILKNHELAINSTLPPLTSKQNDTFVDLITEPFDIFDNENVKVLSGLCVRDLIKFLLAIPLFRASQLLDHLQAAGSMVKKVLESDPDWINSSNKQLFPQFRHFRPFPYRQIPDIDIHVICKKKSEYFRREVLERFLEELGKMLAMKNPAYVESEVKKIERSKANHNNKDKSLKILLEEIESYKEAGDVSAELKAIKFNALATSIFRRNCLKNLSNKSFGNIIAFGKLELVLSEETDFLMTPDRFVMIFKPDIQKNGENALTLSPCDKSGAETLVHQTARIACIPTATDYTFGKACAYITFGYFVPFNTIFKESQNKFKRSIFSKGLSSNGIAVLNRFSKKHLKENLEEGLCILLTMFRFLQFSNGHVIIPKILQHLSKDLLQTSKEPLLNAIQKCLVKFSNHFDLLEKCLRVLPSLKHIEQLKEFWITFKTNVGVAPYTLRLEATPNPFEQIFSSYDTKIIGEMLSILLDTFEKSDTDLPDEVFELIVKWLSAPELKVAAFKYLLKCPNKKGQSLILLHYPGFTGTLSSDLEKASLKKEVTDYFDALSLKEVIDRFSFEGNLSKDYLKWILHLLKCGEASSSIYLIWSNCILKEDQSSSNEIALQLLTYKVEDSFKIIQSTLLNSFEGTEQLQEAVYQKILQLSQNPSGLRRELLNTVEDVLIWVIKGFLKRNKADSVQTFIDKCKGSLPLVSALSKSKINFWHFLTVDDCMDAVSTVIKEGHFENITNGLKYILKQKLTSSQVLTILQEFPSLKNRLEKVHYIFHQDPTNAVVELLQLAFLDPQKKVSITIQIYNGCNELFLLCRATAYLNILSRITKQIFNISYDVYRSANINDETLVSLLIQALKDKNRPLDSIKEEFNKFLNSLIPSLKKNKKDHLIATIVQQIDASSYHFEECKEIYEYRLSEQRKSDSHSSEIQKLFNFVSNLTDKKSINDEINKLLQELLKEDKIEKINDFLVSLKAYNQDYDFNTIGSSVLNRIKVLLKHPALEKCVQLYSIAQERKLHLQNENDYKEQSLEIFRFIQSQNVISKYWKFIHSLIDIFPDLKTLLLPPLYENIPTKYVSEIESSWKTEIEEKRFGGLDDANAARCCIAYVKALEKVRSRRVLDLVQHLEGIKAPFEKANHSIIPFLEAYSKAIFATISDPGVLSREEQLILESYWIFIHSLPDKDKHLKFFRDNYWNILRFRLKSTNINHTWPVWVEIHRKYNEYDSTDFENVKICVEKLFENIREVCRENGNHPIELIPEIEEKILFISKSIRTSKEKDSLAYYLTSIDPLIFINTFKFIRSISICVEGIYWTEIHLSKCPKDKMGTTHNPKTSFGTKSPNKLPKEKMERIHIPKASFGPIFLILSNYCGIKPTYTKELALKISSLFEQLSKNDRYFINLWTQFVSQILNQFYSEKNVIKDSEILVKVWKPAFLAGLHANLKVDSSKIINVLVTLLKMGKQDLFIKIWNSVYMRIVSPEIKPIHFVYRKKESFEQSNILFPMGLDPSKAKVFENDLCLIISKFGETDEFPKEVLPLIFDLILVSINKLLSVQNFKVETSYDKLRTCFTTFLDLVNPHDPLYFMHCTERLPTVLHRMITWNKEFEKEDLFYEGLVKACYTLDEGVQVNIFKSRVGQTVERVFNEYRSFDVRIAPILISHTLQNILITCSVVDYHQFLQYYKEFLNIVTNPETHKLENFKLEPKDFIFDSTPAFVKSLTELVQEEAGSKKIFCEFYQLIGTEYIKFISDERISAEVIVKFLRYPLSWLREFQNTFDGFDNEYQRLGQYYVKTIIQNFPANDLKAAKEIGDNLIAFLTFDPSLSLNKRRGNRAFLINELLKHLAESPHVSYKLLYKKYYAEAKKNQFYVGLPNLEEQGKHNVTL